MQAVVVVVDLGVAVGTGEEDEEGPVVEAAKTRRRNGAPPAHKTHARD
jgi:hypothetical protein